MRVDTSETFERNQERDAETSFSPIAPPAFEGEQLWAVKMETYLEVRSLESRGRGL